MLIGVRCDSRGPGHTSAARYMKHAGEHGGINVSLTLINGNSKVGAGYLAWNCPTAMSMPDVSRLWNACARSSAARFRIAADRTTGPICS